jgi:mRNA interferase RelE/StbE
VKAQFRASFAKDLKRIRDPRILKQIKETIEQVEQAQSLAQIPHIKKLRGNDAHFRIRIGDIRLGLVIVGDTVTFVRCLDRKEVYRYFP